MSGAGEGDVVSKKVGKEVKGAQGWSLVFGGCAFLPVSLGPAGDCPCKD